ncbi:MAG: response regulator [Bacteroidota bacterium]|nr:response regulator [Bacteroidota bacterium]
MQVVIIEDEEFAARRLERMINEIDPDMQIVAKLESVSDSIKWLKNNQQPDLIFMDIHLEDNSSFAIFNSVKIHCPVVFTTATDEKSTIVFKQNKLDYLLKPICADELKKIIEKYCNLPFGERKILDAALFADLVKKP